jgi:hypothetical protein
MVELEEGLGLRLNARHESSPLRRFGPNARHWIGCTDVVAARIVDFKRTMLCVGGVDEVAAGIAPPTLAADAAKVVAGVEESGGQ